MGKVVVSWLYLTCPRLTINVQGVTLIQKQTNVSHLLGATSYFCQKIAKECDYSVAYNDSNSQNYLLGSATMEWKDMVILSWDLWVNMPNFAIPKK